MPRRYARKEKDKAVMAALASNTLAASEQTGIPESTIRYWLERPEFANLRIKTESERAEGYRVASVLALTRLIELIPSMDARDLITFMGVATDKGQLLSGKATDRVEQVSITDGLDDHERELLGAAVRGELARRADERAAVDAVVGARPTEPAGTGE